MKHFFIEYGKIIVAGALSTLGLMFTTPFAETVTGSVANFTTGVTEKSEESIENVSIGLDGGGSGGTADLISFTIDGTTYQTEEGTSWETWASGSDDYSVNSGRIAKTTEGTYLVYEDGGVGVISTNSIQEKSYHTVRMPVHQDQVVIEGETYVMLSDSWNPDLRNPNLYKDGKAYSMDLSQMNFTIVE